VIERGRGASFAAEALQGLSVRRKFVRKKFQRDAPPEAGIFGLIDDTHPTAAELSDDFVMGNGLTDQGVGASA
jgi:hypothetical protein